MQRTTGCYKEHILTACLPRLLHKDVKQHAQPGKPAAGQRANLASLRVPQLDDLVVAAGQEAPPVVAEVDVSHALHSSRTASVLSAETYSLLAGC